MNIKIMFLLTGLCVLALIQEGSSEHYKKKKIVIHVPLHIKEHKHVHTIVKHVHHHHKPQKNIEAPVAFKDDDSHEHFHHHYKHEESYGEEELHR